MINTFQVVSGIGYLVTYEKVRHLVGQYATSDNRVKGLVGGGVGSLVSQTIITPFDVISQHMMVISGDKSNRSQGSRKFSSFANPLLIKRSEALRYGLSIAVVRELYRTDGFRGFYRGYFASLATYVPSSACWWMFYPIYTDIISTCLLSPSETSHMLIQVIAGTSSGMTVTALTNPLDVVRANIQVQRTSFSLALQRLWQEEGLRLLAKGLSARMTQSCISSAFIVAGYETLKRWSVKEEFKDQIRW